MKYSTLKALAPALVMLASCGGGGGSARMDARDGGSGGAEGPAETSPPADVTRADAPSVADAGSDAAPSSDGGPGTVDAASADGPGTDDDGPVDAAKADGPGGDQALEAADASKLDSNGGRDAADGPRDLPNERALDVSAGDGGTSPGALPTLGFRSVAPGVSFTCALGTDDSLWCWGGLLTTVATAFDSARAWQSLDLGVDSACAIARDGTLWCWGTNLFKQLGLGNVSATGVSAPTQVGTEGDWKQVSMGATVTCGLRGAGALWCWGTSSALGGEVGDGSTSARSTPVSIGSTNDWTGVSAGETHTCGLRAPGTLWCWGQAGSGQLGLGMDDDRFLPRPIESKVPAQVGTAEDWRAVSAGGSHSCGIRATGSLWCWGNNAAGQLGSATTPSSYAASPVQVGTALDWASVTAGSQHTCATRADRTVWCWGSSAYGQVGAGGQGNVLEPARVAEGANWQQVQAGSMHTCGVRDDTSVWCWGRNHSGQLGAGSLPIHNSLTQVGTGSDWQRVTTQGLHTCGLRAGALWCWGQNTYGNLGDGTTEHRQEPTRVGSATDWTSVVVGQGHTCGLRADHSLWCWGANGDGALGIGTALTAPAGIATTPRQVAADKTWLAVDAALHTCALAADGSLWCWGQNSYDVLGPAGTYETPTRYGSDSDWVAISVDGGRTCGLRADHSLWCWGYQLGSTPVRIGETLDWRTASARYQYFCGIKLDGSLWCGDLKATLVRRGDATDWVEATPACGVRASGSLLCQLGGGTGVPIDTATDWMTAGAADPIVCAVKRNGTLWCGGTGQTGELGHGDAWRTSPVPVLMTP